MRPSSRIGLSDLMTVFSLKLMISLSPKAISQSLRLTLSAAKTDLMPVSEIRTSPDQTAGKTMDSGNPYADQSRASSPPFPGAAGR